MKIDLNCVMFQIIKAICNQNKKRTKYTVLAVLIKHHSRETFAIVYIGMMMKFKSAIGPWMYPE
jgi:hypothetical protein